MLRYPYTAQVRPWVDSAAMSYADQFMIKSLRTIFYENGTSFSDVIIVFMSLRW
jgi:hypothetical protein